MAKKREKSVNVSGKPKHSLDVNRDNGGGTKGGRSASMYKTRPNAKGKYLKHDLQSKELPSTRDRRWFGNTRVVNQKELEFFQDELQTRLSSNYNVILKERKLPMSLLNDHQKHARVHLLDTEPFADAFGPKKKRKRPKLVVSDYEALAKKADGSQDRPKRTLLGWKDKTEKKENESPVVFRNREKVLVTCSRRINYRYRHLMLNVVSILPHCKKESKVESKATKGATLNELVELKSCSSCLFFECRKHNDLYLWMAKCPSGPSVKFLVNAVHTMEELKLTGNHLNGSRPLLSFSTNFDKDPRWKLLKEMIMQIFGTPKDHRKSKPYHDHVFVFSIVDDHIWFRNYQISCPHAGADKIDRGGLEKMTLVEVGPRFCLNPIKIFGGSFGGPTLYENPFYVSPNQIRALEKKQKAGKYAKKVKAKTRRKMHELSNPLEQDEFADIWKD